MKNALRIFAVLIALVTGAAHAQNAPKVMLFGVFHFANPGLDVVKTDQINVMTPENQAYLDGLADRLAEFKPTKILLEFEPARDAELQQRLTGYRDGSFELTSNEVYQLGFRIAARTDGATIHGFDERSVHWQAEPLFAYLQESDPETQTRLDTLYEQITEEMQEAHSTLSLRDLLLLANDAAKDRLNRASYLMTNHVGTSDNFVGADATASWWHRNFRMYAHVQRYAQPGDRVLVIGGQGHVAILRTLLDDDPDRVAVDVRPYF
jgi:hypothetical protein